MSVLVLCCRAGKPVFERPSAIELESDPFLTTTLPGDDTDTSDTILQIAREKGTRMPSGSKSSHCDSVALWVLSSVGLASEVCVDSCMPQVF